MKKTTSFHLEEDILEEIEEYKEKYKLSSRNVALERMLLERRNILSFQINTFPNRNDYVDIDKKEKNKLSKSIESTYNDMPE